ncbi:hypothetical protein LTS18_009831 [Coniosporium uncinatum]|uniref:Uncharacterized protein n=1 Tax=Coniosporium uncinatum TaxID=93489 RepID=A0ACC3D0J5_9PEZI|nr:hypothetical protein LTS18_009831 [Coniosporium uncinatum]
MSSTTRSLFSYLPPTSICLATLVGCLEVLPFGIGGLASPKDFAIGYGLPLAPPHRGHPRANGAQTDDEDPDSELQKTQKALVQAIAARNIQNGVLILAFAWFWRDRRALGTVVSCGLITTIADTLLVRWYGVQGAIWGHFVGIANSSLIGGSLLYWM